MFITKKFSFFKKNGLEFSVLLYTLCLPTLADAQMYVGYVSVRLYSFHLYVFPG